MPGEACLMGKKSVKRKVIFSYNNNGCSSQTIQRRYCFDVFLLLSKSPLLERLLFFLRSILWSSSFLRFCSFLRWCFIVYLVIGFASSLGLGFSLG